MEIDTGTTELLCSVRDGVALITLNRPEARNAMSPDLTEALRTQIKARGDADAVGALLITGAGMLGLTATALARRMGTGSITMVDPIPWRCEKALLMGANRAIGAFPSKTGNLEPVDAWLELSGTNTAWESGFDMLGVGASVVLVGSVFPTPDTCFNLERVVRRMISIRGVHNYAPRHLSMALGLLEKLGPTHPLGGLTGPWFTLANHAEALRAAADPQVLRVGFRPE